MRTELAIDGAPIDGTEEIVAEYAVDLDLQLTAVTAISPNGVDPTKVEIINSANALFPTFAAPVFGTANTPERIRSVRVRLGVRSREGDRTLGIGTPTQAQGLFRFNLGTADGESFARVRTFQTDVALHNQTDILW